MDRRLNLKDWHDAIRQKQFLDVISRDEAMERFRRHLDLRPRSSEQVSLSAALGRVLAGDVPAPVDVPGFDRSNVDGFALRASDTSGASEEDPRELTLNPEVLVPGAAPRLEVRPGTATPIATGGAVPRGADAVVMIEHTEAVAVSGRKGQSASGSSAGSDLPEDTFAEAVASTRADAEEAATKLRVYRSAAPGHFITFAGTDMARGETVLRRGQVVTSREAGVLAALGLDTVSVLSRPRVAVISTGNEIVAPGNELAYGCVYDSNAAILTAAVSELGCQPVPLGTVRDDVDRLREIMRRALDCDAVILSGGTSKGAGDLSYQVVSELSDPGIVAHGVALKPGKPICLAVTDGRPVVVLPGFPTSAVFTFHEFVAPVLRELAGMPPDRRATVQATLPQRVNSERGRTEYLLVSLVRSADSPDRSGALPDRSDRASGCGLSEHGLSESGLSESGLSENGEADRDGAERELPETETAGENSPENVSSGSDAVFTAWPMGRGSGSVTTFSLADGFVTIDQHTEQIDEGEPVTVTLLSDGVAPADLVIVGSHCVGLDLLVGALRQRGFQTRVLSVGSMGGVNAVRRGECDAAGVHLMDPRTGEYNRQFVSESVCCVPGYRRKQGIVFRPGDQRFEGHSPEAAVRNALDDPACAMVNRNPGSGTRILIDQLLGARRPAGFHMQTRSHNAVAAAIVQNRADWGVAIQSVAAQYGLGFLPLQDEHYDFLIPTRRRHRPAVRAFLELLSDAGMHERLREIGMQPTDR